MARFEVSIVGLKHLELAFAALPARVQKKVLGPALREAAKLFLAEAKARAPVKSGLLQRSLIIRASKRSRSRISFGVFFKNVEKLVKYAGGKRYFYPFAVEYGHVRAPAHPFLRTAFDATKDQAARLASQLIAAGIEREAADAARVAGVTKEAEKIKVA